MTAAGDQQAEQDLGVLLGIRNTLERFTEYLEADAKRTQAVELTLQPHYPPLYAQLGELRTQLDSLIERWPTRRRKIDPLHRVVVFHGQPLTSESEVQLAQELARTHMIITGEDAPRERVLCFTCKEDGCDSYIRLPEEPLGSAALLDWLTSYGWSHHPTRCPPHAAQARAAKIAAEGQRLRDGHPIQENPDA